MDSSILEFGHIHLCKLGFQSEINNGKANSADPDETAHNEPSHLDLHYLHRFAVWSTINNILRIIINLKKNNISDGNSGT